MNAKEARKIIAKHEADKCECFEGECMDEAQGYLAALEGPEVKALLKAVEQFVHSPVQHRCEHGILLNEVWLRGAEEALAQFRESVKEQ